MTDLSLTLLGSFVVKVEGQPFTRFRSDKVRALLAYLALEPAHRHHRPVLAGLLWPEVPDRQARQSLRVALHNLRQSLDGAAPGLSPQLLDITHQTVQLASAKVSVDVTEFQTLLAASKAHSHEHLSDCSTCLGLLERAVALYRGELLTGFGLADAAPFEEWLLLRREMLHQQAILACKNLADAYETAHLYEQAYTYATQLIKLDLYREGSHRQLMRLLAWRGLPDQALAQYESCRQLLGAELGVEPEAETTALFNEIRTGQFQSWADPQPDFSPTAASLAMGELKPAEAQPHFLDVPATGLFLGRQAELRQLRQWLVEDGCQLIAILGIGGMGKTTLAAQAVWQRVTDVDARKPDLILWRSLLNAPPLAELLPPLLQILSDQQLAAIPKSLDEQLRLFMGYLHDKRVLLILDNLESILEAEHAGAFRSGYEAYGQLIQQVATREHRSQLLLTSRERPRGFARLEGDSPRVQSLKLAGLDDEAAHQLLARYGLQGPGEENFRLVARYSGNPLALKLVADTVDEFFGGDIAGFLADEAPVFDDIRSVLDQQFARLSELEREILFWLAVEREPTPGSSLRESLLQQPAQHTFVEALRDLQRRSLIERHESGFALQNVVTEYLTDRLIEIAIRELETGQIDILHRQALLKAQAKVYVRQSQARLILNPIGERLLTRFGHIGLADQLQSIIADLQKEQPHLPSYAGGNILNLLLHLNIDLTHYDFSGLNIRQANLQGAALPSVNFSGANFAGTIFTDTFGSVHSLVISSPSNLLATGTSRGLIHLWRLADMRPENVFKGHTNLITSLAFSPDGRLLASGSVDRTVRLWDISSGQTLRIFLEHHAPVRTVAFSPDGEYLVSGSEDWKIRFWKVRSGELTATLEQHSDWVTALSFQPDGQLMASSGEDQSIHIWDVQALSGQTKPTDSTPTRPYLVRTLQGHSQGILDLAFTPDGLTLASSSMDHTIRLWDISSGKVKHTLRGHTGFVWSVSFSSDGSILGSGSADGAIRLWDVHQGRTLNTLRGHTHAIRAIAFSPNGETLISGGLDNTIRLWDLRLSNQGQIFNLLQGYDSFIVAVTFSPEGSRLVTGNKEGRLHLWNVKNPRVEPQFPQPLGQHEAQVRALAFSPNGSRLVSVSDDKTVRLWAISGVKSGLEVSSELLGTYTKGLKCVVYAHHDEIVASAGDDGLIHIWDVKVSQMGQLRRILRGHSGPIHGLALSPDDQLLVSSGTDGSIRLWRVATGECLHSLEEDSESFLTLDFHPGGDIVATGDKAGRICLWSVRSQRITLLKALTGHKAGLHQVAFSLDGKLLASSSADRTVRLWDGDTGSQRHILDEHKQPVYAVAFRSDGAVLASGSYDGTVKLWQTQTGVCLQTLRLPGPYEGLNLSDVTGLTEAQKSALKVLGAVEVFG